MTKSKSASKGVDMTPWTQGSIQMRAENLRHEEVIQDVLRWAEFLVSREYSHYLK